MTYKSAEHKHMKDYLCLGLFSFFSSFLFFFFHFFNLFFPFSSHLSPHLQFLLPSPTLLLLLLLKQLLRPLFFSNSFLYL